MSKPLIIGVGQVDLLFRQARSLKDKRNVLKSIAQRLRNEGFSVTECGEVENLKQGTLGFSYAGHGQGHVKEMMDKISVFFLGDFQVLRKQTEVFDYSNDSDSDVLWSEEDEGEWK